MSTPALYVTNVSDARARLAGFAGSRNVWSIIARPDVAAGEAGHGRCWPLVPDTVAASNDRRAAANVARVAAQVNFDDQHSAVAREHDVPEIDVAARIIRSQESPGLVCFRDHYLDGPARHVDGTTYAPRRSSHPDIRPGNLLAQANAGRGLVDVAAGDTLICSCSRERAAAGQCHRAWAAVLLVAHGWRVILDGAELDLHRPPEALRGLWPRPDMKARPA